MRIFIITPCYNAAKTVLYCAESVRTQSRCADHIIVDGQSNDDTINLLDKSSVYRFVSEPDHGVYDAMNKGLKMSEDGIIGILNADDFYAHPDVLKKVASVFEDSAIESCYGDLVYVDYENTDKILRYWKAGRYDYRKFYWGWMPPHPTFFVRHSLYEKYGLFNTNCGTAADYELMLRFMVKYRITSAYIPEVLVKMRVGGISNATIKNRLKANRMDRYAWEVNGLSPYPWSTFFKPIRKIYQFINRPKTSALSSTSSNLPESRS